MEDLSRLASLDAEANELIPRGTQCIRLQQNVESRSVRDVEREVAALRQNLVETIHKYQLANEELHASNEEVKVTNDELRSVNEQLREKMREVDRSHSDLFNLVRSSDIATVFLDRDLRIQRFTPSVAVLLNLKAEDVGRPFSDLVPPMADRTLFDDCRTVLSQLAPIERVLVEEEQVAPEDFGQHRPKLNYQRTTTTNPEETGPRSLLRRVLPYRTKDDRIEGVVITFIDITQRVAAEAQSRRLAAVLRDSNDAITVHDFDGQILAWNRGAEKMYGYSESEALGMNLREVIPAERTAELTEYIGKISKDESVDLLQTQRITKDYRTLDVELTAAAYRNIRGYPIGVAVTERDVTERNRLTSRLAQLNATLEQRIAEQTREVRLLAEAISHLGEGIIITSEELDEPGPQIIFVNEAMCRMSGYMAHELIGTTPRILQGEKTDRAKLDEVRRNLADAKSCLVELVNYRKDGAAYDTELFMTPLADANGRVTNFVSIQRDITERKRNEVRLRESEERMRAVLNTAFDGIILIDNEGVIVSANPATERMFGYSNQELIGQQARILMPQPYGDEHLSHRMRFRPAGGPRMIGAGQELIGLRKDGTQFPVELAVSQVERMRLFTGIIRDISVRKELEKHILEIASREQRRIGQELHDGTGQQLTGLSLFAGALVDILDRSPQRDANDGESWRVSDGDLQRLRSTARRMSQQLLDANQHVQKLSHGIMPVHIEPEGLRSALNYLAVTTHGVQNIQCRFQCPEDVTVPDNTAATHLYRIAQEAINNAVKHSQASEIWMTLRRGSTSIILEVADNGIGFDPHTRARAFGSATPQGFGIDIMNYRAGILCGQLLVSRREEGGTQITCVVPTLGAAK